MESNFLESDYSFSSHVNNYISVLYMNINLTDHSDHYDQVKIHSKQGESAFSYYAAHSWNWSEIRSEQ